MVIPFINFPGQCDEAIKYYENLFEVTDKRISYFRDIPKSDLVPISDEFDDYVLHSEMKINGTPVWMGDTTGDIAKGDMVTLAVAYELEEDVRRVFEALSKEGTILIPLESTFYSPAFGCVKDKFGVIWHLITR